jgi:hypothetical protein
MVKRKNIRIYAVDEIMKIPSFSYTVKFGIFPLVIKIAMLITKLIIVISINIKAPLPIIFPIAISDIFTGLVISNFTAFVLRYFDIDRYPRILPRMAPIIST